MPSPATPGTRGSSGRTGPGRPTTLTPDQVAPVRQRGLRRGARPRRRRRARRGAWRRSTRSRPRPTPSCRPPTTVGCPSPRPGPSRSRSTWPPAPALLRDFTHHAPHRRHLPRPRRPRREPLLGPGRVQEAREAPPLPVAPGQRLRVRRAAAVPHVLGGAHRRHRRQRLPAGGARASTAWARCSTPTSTRSASSASSDPEGAVAAEVAAGGVVVFSSLTPHLTGPNTTDAVRKAYILQYAPAGAPGAARRSRRRARPTAGSRPTHPTGSTPCCAAGRPADLLPRDPRRYRLPPWPPTPLPI